MWFGFPQLVLTGSPSRGGGCYGLCQRHKPTELAHSFLVCSCVYFCLCGPFDCILFHKLSRQLSFFSFCSSRLISALLVLSTINLFRKVSFSPDIILCGWLGLKHLLTNNTRTHAYTHIQVHTHVLSAYLFIYLLIYLFLPCFKCLNVNCVNRTAVHVCTVS